ncbi:MAG: hypothetical protein ABSF70_19215 [Terracidiphilus sp.]|jgi:hypothetical protein
MILILIPVLRACSTLLEISVNLATFVIAEIVSPQPSTNDPHDGRDDSNSLPAIQVPFANAIHCLQL